MSKKNKKNKGRPLNLPWTAAEALAAGWTRGDTRLARGYRSRKTKLDEVHIYLAGGYRDGQYYYDWPSFTTTYYYNRVYICPPAGWVPKYAADAGAEG